MSRRTAATGPHDPIVSLRMPVAMRDTLDALARASYRSRSAEILVRLEWSLQKDHAAILAISGESASENRGGDQQ